MDIPESCFFGAKPTTIAYEQFANCPITKRRCSLITKLIDTKDVSAIIAQQNECRLLKSKVGVSLSSVTNNSLQYRISKK